MCAAFPKPSRLSKTSFGSYKVFQTVIHMAWIQTESILDSTDHRLVLGQKSVLDLRSPERLYTLASRRGSAQPALLYTCWSQSTLYKALPADSIARVHFQFYINDRNFSKWLHNFSVTCLTTLGVYIHFPWGCFLFILCVDSLYTKNMGCVLVPAETPQNKLFLILTCPLICDASNKHLGCQYMLRII